MSRTQVREERAEETFQTYPFTELFISRAFRPWPDLLSLVSGRLSPAGRGIIMANEAPPADPGQGFALEGVREYESAGRRRYFWALVPASMPR